MSRSNEWSRPPHPARAPGFEPRFGEAHLLEREREQIFGCSWHVACHESELPLTGDYRAVAHPANVAVVVVRGADRGVRAFFNVCLERGTAYVREPAGNVSSLRCGFHPSASCLRCVRTEIDPAGFVWLTLDAEARTLDDYLGGALDGFAACLFAKPLEVFSLQRAVVAQNWKHWHATNSASFYALLQPSDGERREAVFRYGHVTWDRLLDARAYRGDPTRALAFPGLEPHQWKMAVLFPGTAYSVLGSSLRVDGVIPLAHDRVAIERRGVGFLGDAPDERAARVRDFNAIWGPFGRDPRARSRATHEDAEPDLRSFYAEWGRRMGRSMREAARPQWALAAG